MDKIWMGQALGVARMALGCGWLAPVKATGLLGLDADENPALPFVSRLLFARDFALGLAIVTDTGEGRRRTLRQAAAVDLADATAAVIAGAKGQVPRRTAAMSAAAALAGAALGMYVQRS